MADLSVMSFLNEETQQEAEYNIKDAYARQSILALQNSVGSLGDSVDAIEAKIPDNASSSNKLATISDVSAAYKPKGNATLATLPQLVIANLNTVYNMTEDFVTTSDFAEGAGVSVEAGNEVGIINIAPEGSGAVNLKYTVLGGFIDTSGFYNTSETLETDVDGQDKFPFYDFSAGAKRQVTFGSIKAKLKEYFDLFYTNLVSPAINGNFAGLDANGNLIDSGKKASDFATTGNAIANTKLIKDTVGWSGKNKLRVTANTQTVNGVSFTINNDKSVKANGTATADVYFNVFSYSEQPMLPIGNYLFGCGVAKTDNYQSYLYERNADNTGWGAAYVDETGNGVEYTRTADRHFSVIIYVKNGATINNVTFYPMLRDADILDDTYEPYFGSTAFPRSEQAVLGAKNINGTRYVSQTSSSVVWTANDDGSITAVSGTATGNNGEMGAGINDAFVAPFTAQVKIIGGLSSNIYLYPYDYTDSARPYKDATKTGRLTVSDNQWGDTPLEFYMIKGHKYVIAGRVLINVTANNNTMYPRLLLASDTDTSFSAPAMPNRELTEKAFKYVDYLASKDLNNITETGFYKLDGSITNGPGVNYGFLEVFKTDANNITQIVHGLSTGEFIYSRRYYNSTWGSWYKFTGTAL